MKKNETRKTEKETELFEEAVQLRYQMVLRESFCTHPPSDDSFNTKYDRTFAD